MFQIRHLGKKNLLEGQGSTGTQGYPRRLCNVLGDFQTLPRQSHSWHFLVVIAPFHVGIDLYELHWPPLQPALLFWMWKCCDSIKHSHSYTPLQGLYMRITFPGGLVSLDLSIFSSCSISHQHPVIKRDADEAGCFNLCVNLRSWHSTKKCITNQTLIFIACFSLIKSCTNVCPGLSANYIAVSLWPESPTWSRQDKQGTKPRDCSASLLTSYHYYHQMMIHGQPFVTGMYYLNYN